MLLLQVMMVAIFKLNYRISESKDNIGVTPVCDDGHHIQAQ